MPDVNNEKAYALQQWKDNSIIAKVFTGIVLLHTIYWIVINYLMGTVMTVSIYVSFFAVYVPISLIVFLMAMFTIPIRHRWSSHLWYALITIESIMIAFVISLRTILCYYHLEPPNSCSYSGRPLAMTSYSIIYVLLGPFLILNVLNNNLFWQIAGMMVVCTIVVWSVFVVTAPPVLLATATIFVIGAQCMALLVAKSRSDVQRIRYESAKRNEQLTESLKDEVHTRTLAQSKAADEEKKRTQFTNVLFHEMRVPLNSVILSMNDLENDEEVQKLLDTEARDNFDRINGGLQSIITIINESLDFNKMREGKFQIVEKPFNLRKMFDEVINGMKAGWVNKRISFIFDFDERLDNIEQLLLGDSVRLKQVVSNYLSNAIKFTPDDGQITLKVVEDGREDSKSVWINVTVLDDGVGIAPEDQKKLFRPFVQINPEKLQSGKGSGLGLSICASIIDTMGGSYGIISQLGKGSAFWFRVKLLYSDVDKIRDEVATNKVRNATETPPAKKLNILVTDDDASTRKVMRRLLEKKFGHHVEEAADGLECVEEVSTKPTNFYNIIYIDNQMPRMNGLDAIKLLRSRGYTNKLISLTGTSDVQTTQELLRNGADKILLKPITLAMLKETLIEVALKGEPDTTQNTSMMVDSV